MSNRLDNFGKTARRVGLGMTAAITAPLAALGASSIKVAMDLDEAMRNIQSVGGQTDLALSGFRKTFVDMSMDMDQTFDSAQNLAEAFYDIQGSGFAGEDAMMILKAATKAASAGLTETSVSAEGLTAVLNSYGLEAESATDITDLMFRTVDRGVGSYEELTSSMSNVVGMAATIGVEFEEVSAAMATMSKQGFTFSEASVSINQALVSFIKPTEDMGAAIAQLGFSSGEALLEAEGLGGAMALLAEHTGGSTEAMAGLFGNVRGLRAALALTGEGAAIFTEDLEAMADAGGATAHAFEVQSQSFAALSANFQNTIAGFQESVGRALMPALIAIMNAIKPILEGFVHLPPGVQTTIVAILALVAALGPLLMILGAVASGISALSAVMPLLAAAAALISVPLLPLIAILGGLAFIFFQLATRGQELWTTLKQLGALVGVAVVMAFRTLWAWIVQTASAIGTFIKWVVAGIAAIAALVVAFGRMLSAKIQKGLEAWGQNLKNLGRIMQQWAEDAKNSINDAANTWQQNLNNMVTIYWKTIEMWRQNFANLGKIFELLGAAIMRGLILGVRSKINEFLTMVAKLANDAANAVKNAFGISSPSKVMMKMGEQVVEGFNLGVAGAGGIGVNVPGMSRSGGMSTQPALSPVGAGGDVYHIYPPFGSTQEQMQFIMRELGKESKKRGAR